MIDLKSRYRASNKYINVICISEPDIQYTHNKALKVGERYFAKYNEEIVGSHTFRCCDIYDENKIKMGNYFAKDFMSTVKWRDEQLKSILQ